MASVNAPAWRKSTFSGNDGNCVEIANWRKSSRSGNEGDCIEVGNWRKSTRSQQSCIEVGSADLIVVRDTKLGEKSPVLEIPPAAWSAFIASLMR